MGFDGIFWTITKRDELAPDLTRDEALQVESYYDYIDSDWSKEHYKTFEDYIKSTSNYNDIIDSSTALRYYVDDVNNLFSFTRTGFTTIHEWASDPINNITRNDLIQMKHSALNLLSTQFELVPVSISNSFKCNEDESYTIQPCYGVEVSIDDNFYTRVYTQDSECSHLMLFKDLDCDIDQYYLLRSFVKFCDKLIEDEHFFDKNLLYYTGSW